MDALSKTILNCMDRYAPEKCLPVSGKTHTASWMSNKIKNALVKRDRLFKRCIENLDKNILFHEKSRNNVTRLIGQKRRQFPYDR